MATLPHFAFPPEKESEALDTTTSAKKDRPCIHIVTEADLGQGYTSEVLSNTHLRPTPTRTVSTPPASPTSTRVSIMDSQNSQSVHDSGAVTPPATPTLSKSNLASSDFLNTLSSLRRGDSVSSSTSERPRIDSIISSQQRQKPESTELITFPYHLSDYAIQTDDNGKKRPIGSGAWSDVYLARPTLSIPSNQPKTLASPPITPTHSRTSSQESHELPLVPLLYAIKSPAGRQAKKVLADEARILSYLSRLPSAASHVVTFYGQDPRTDALVLKAMACTLEDWMQRSLNTLDEQLRAQKLAAVFPELAASLLASLEWMHEHGCVHADVKPANILIALSSDGVPAPLFSDFSAARLVSPVSSAEAEEAASPLGAGTWDFLDPVLLSVSSPVLPSPASDLWALAVSLLVLVVGASPYEAFKGNKFQQREMIKQGGALQCLAQGDDGMRSLQRVKSLSLALGFDVMKWFAGVLRKDMGKRVGLETWKGLLESGVAGSGMRL